MSILICYNYKKNHHNINGDFILRKYSDKEKYINKFLKKDCLYNNYDNINELDKINLNITSIKHENRVIKK